MVWPGDSPGRRYSGSSLPITSLVHRKSSPQSSLGTPRIHAIDREREWRGDALDEVERTLGVRGRRFVEDLERDPLDVVAPSPHGPRREARVRDLAHRTVPRRVEHHDHLRRPSPEHRHGAA